MYISLIIVSVLYVGIAESITCYDCVGTSNDTQAGRTSSCPISMPTRTCDSGDVCLVTTLNYYDSIAPLITIVWRQCGNSASLPSGVNTGQCAENGAAFNQKLYLDRNLCCYKLEYNQTQMQHDSNVTYCFCTSDKCNDLLFRTNFTFSGSTQVPGVSPTSGPTQAPGVSTTTKPSNTATGFNLDLSGNLVSVFAIPIASTAVVSVVMILAAVCLWKMSANQLPAKI